MKLLIAVKSCLAHASFHESIRNTWGKDVPSNVDLRFFVGRDVNCVQLMNDEVMLDVPDDYDGLPYKTRGILEYSLLNGVYDYTFLCDTDTFVIVSKLLQSGFEQFDYMGMNGRKPGVVFPYNAVDRWKRSHPIRECYPWASGGFGYFLSRKAAGYVAAAEPNIWAEDLWVGQIMGPLYNEGKITMSGDRRLEGVCTWHFPQHLYGGQYDPKFGWMERMYKEKR